MIDLRDRIINSHISDGINDVIKSIDFCLLFQDLINSEAEEGKIEPLNTMLQIFSAKKLVIPDELYDYDVNENFIDLISTADNEMIVQLAFNTIKTLIASPMDEEEYFKSLIQ